MPDIKWNVVLRNPLTALKILLLGSCRSTVVLLARIIFPFRYRKLTLRDAYVREWVITAFSANPNIFCSEPRGHKCQEVVFSSATTNGSNDADVATPDRNGKIVVGGWIVPNTDVADLKHKDAVIVYAHGGGYALGHGLQNLSMFKRQVKKAKAVGQDIAFAPVKYR